MPRAPPVTTAVLLSKSIRFMRGVLEGPRLRRLRLWIDAPPAESAEKTNQAAQANTPWPAKLAADPWRDDRREHPTGVATRVADGRRGAALASADFDGRRPERSFTGAHRAQGQGEPGDNPSRIAGQHTEAQQDGAQDHARGSHDGPSTPQTGSSCQPVRQPAAQGHGQGHRDLRNACVEFAGRFTQAQNLV